MKTITIKTQEEFDALPNGFDEYTRIYIKSKANSLLTVNRKIGNAHVVARGSSHVEAWGSSHVEAWESSHVVARESSHVVARGSSHVVAQMNASIKVQNRSVVIERITQQAIAICLEECEVAEKDDTAQVIVCPRTLYDKETFLDIYREQVDGDYITLYKSVKPKTLCDFYTGRIKYEGVVTCPDFDPDNSRECGGGLHLSPSPDLALSYNQGKVLKCRVHKDDFVVYPHNVSKVRCKKVEVVGEP